MEAGARTELERGQVNMLERKAVLNDKLRRARRKRFLTIEEAAEILKVSATSFGRWERRTQKPHLETLGKLCALFNATPEELGFEDLSN